VLAARIDENAVLGIAGDAHHPSPFPIFGLLPPAFYDLILIGVGHVISPV
jgi:hypothetical protein